MKIELVCKEHNKDLDMDVADAVVWYNEETKAFEVDLAECWCPIGGDNQARCRPQWAVQVVYTTE